jgi:tubulin-specific chaperone D
MDNTDDCAALNLATDDIEELQSFVHGVAHSSGSQSAELFPRFSRIIMHYQEQPQLLDPVLESLVCPLTKALLSIAFLPAKGDATSVPVLPHTFDRDRLVHTTRFLWQLASVRGYKTIVRFMPNDVAIFEPVVGLLEAVSLPRVSDAIDPGNGHLNAASEATETPASANWEAQYVLLMWLSLLVLIPFDLVLLDSSLGHSVTARDESAAVIAPLGARLIRLSRRFLRCSGPTREMAAVLLGRLVTRRDLEPALSEFADWGSRSMSLKEDDDPQTAFVVPGVVLSFATTFKLGDRQAMLPIAARVLHPATQLLSSPSAANNALVRKLCVKLIQRAALCFLPQNTAAWRYQKRHRTLQAAISSPPVGTASAETTTNLELQNTNGDAHVCMSESVNGVVRTYTLKESDVGIDNGVGLGGEWVVDVDHAASVESAIESMLCALGDKDTVVRWSAAKGLGRITGRLPRGMADEVVGAVLSSFTDPLGDVATWHGGCLALAELTRRGLLLPERLSQAVPLVVKALQYDVRRGHCSVGANVRDSAAYVCWAVARAYASSTLGKAVDTLAPALITAAVYDREVNCRRAAAAAFQECVGRLGSFPYGIEILTAADYFSVSLRTAVRLSLGLNCNCNCNCGDYVYV